MVVQVVHKCYPLTMDGIRCCNMRIAVCGVGYTGIITAVVLCEFGHTLFCYDIDPELLDSLQNISIIEPGLDTLIQHYKDCGKLKIATDLSTLLQNIDVVFLTVPVKGQGTQDIDLSQLISLLENITPYLSRDRYLPLFLKTAVPVGTSAVLANNVSQMRPDLVPGLHYDIINNPNFMREGSAVHDLMKPDRVIFGLSQTALQEIDSLARKTIDNIFSPLQYWNVPFLYTNYETAELIKSATTGLVTIKMAYANEIEKLCNNAGIDLKVLFKGIGSDRRVSSGDLLCNAGIGGSSLPRTSRLLVESAKKFGADLSILSIALTSNKKRIQSISDKILHFFKNSDNSHNHKASVLGIAFKPLSDDIRESPSLSVIRELLNNKINVSLYDPYYLPKSFNIKNIPQDIMTNKYFSICSSAYDAVCQSDVLVIMTNWPQFAQLDMEKIKELMGSTYHTPVLFDCHNMFQQYSQSFLYIAA